MANARLTKDNWFICARCGHKLGRAMGDWNGMKGMPAIEIKCHSCKTLNYIMVGNAGKQKTNS